MEGGRKLEVAEYKPKVQFNSIQFNSLFTLYKIFTKVYIVGK